MEAALELEKKVNQALIHLHKLADTHNDCQVRGCVIDGNGVMFLVCLWFRSMLHVTSRWSLVNPGHVHHP